MPLHWFAPPVKVETDVPGRAYAVTNVERAAEFLLSWRDGEPRPEWRSAIVACMAAIKGEAPADTARVLFEAAARECGMLLED